MRHNRFQNHVSESSFTLPLCMVMGTLVWFWDGTTGAFGFSMPSLAALLLAVLTTYVVIETATTYALLRIRSRMISSVWVALVSMMPFLHTFSPGWVAALALAGSYHVMFAAYQRHEPVLDVFHTFVLLSVASLAVPMLCFLVPLYYWYLFVFLRCMSWRCFWAGIVGLVLPVSFAAGWGVVADDYGFLAGRLQMLQSVEFFNIQDYQPFLSPKNLQTLDFAFITLLSLVGITHYLRNYYNDKIRTRMYLYIYVGQTMALWLMVVCAPSMWTTLAPVLTLGAATMVAHYFALTGSIISNLFFCLTLLGLVCMYTLNFGLWTL